MALPFAVIGLRSQQSR